jgi:peptide/nickel transport system substrate-binding protein
VQYSKDRTADVYPAYQLGWFPDYSDADNYLTPFFLKKNFLGNHYDNQAVNDLILKQADRDRQGQAHGRHREDPGHRREGPLDRAAAAGQAGRGDRQGREGVTLDASFKLRFAPITK